MADLILRASDDHVARIAHEGDPVRAVVELVWNAIDAEVTTVTVVLERDAMDAITQVRVVDNGHGITSDEVESTFGRIGGSWKQRTEKSKNGLRTLHGTLGQGRLRAFALGSRVTWTSTSTPVVGEREEVTIKGSGRSRDRFTWERTVAPGTGTGTTVTVHNDEQRSLGALEADDVLPTLRAHFAPVLLNDQTLAITYDGSPLDPSQEILHDSSAEIVFGENDAQGADRSDYRVAQRQASRCVLRARS